MYVFGMQSDDSFDEDSTCSTDMASFAHTMEEWVLQGDGKCTVYLHALCLPSHSFQSRSFLSLPISLAPQGLILGILTGGICCDHAGKRPMISNRIGRDKSDRSRDTIKNIETQI